MTGPFHEREMKMSLDESNVVIRSMVLDRMAELRTSNYQVKRVRNDEVLSTFEDNIAALAFIDDNDYNPERVIVVRNGPDGNSAEELEFLRDFDRECRNDIPGWEEGSRVYKREFVDETFARNRATEKGYDLNAWPYTAVNWDRAADDLKVEAVGRSRYATLDSTRYYYFGA
jgi:hypothetical protein